MLFVFYSQMTLRCLKRTLSPVLLRYFGRQPRLIKVKQWLHTDTRLRGFLRLAETSRLDSLLHWRVCAMIRGRCRFLLLCSLVTAAAR